MKFDVYLNPHCQMAVQRRVSRERLYWIVDATSEDTALDTVLVENHDFSRWDLRICKIGE